MDGYGFLKAARQYSNVHALIVRGISDLVENKSAADKQGS